MNILGTLFSSTAFPGRSPAGHATLTTFVGGTRNPDVGQNSSDQLQSLVLQDLERLLDVREIRSSLGPICGIIPFLSTMLGTVNSYPRWASLNHPTRESSSPVITATGSPCDNASPQASIQRKRWCLILGSDRGLLGISHSVPVLFSVFYCCSSSHRDTSLHL